MITHYDLFAGIGGFSLALEEVFTDEPIRHIFCDWESFPTAVLKQHWPDGEFWGDISDLVANTRGAGLEEAWASQQTEGSGRSSESTSGTESERVERQRWEEPSHAEYDGRNQFTIVTGGFPCQPFSHAGRRKGTADDRYQWPNMFAVIRNTKPEWVIAENVRGLVTWNDGLVLETVCADLESEGYEVQPFIIPACAVGAPHRRDRVWIIAHRSGTASGMDKQNPSGQERQPTELTQPAMVRPADRQTATKRGETSSRTPITDTRPQRRGERSEESLQPSRQKPSRQEHEYPDWSRNWQEVAFATCDDSMDDGLQGWLVRLPDGSTITRAKHRKEALKAYGNGIVPQVAMGILRGIKASM